MLVRVCACVCVCALKVKRLTICVVRGKQGVGSLGGMGGRECTAKKMHIECTCACTPATFILANTRLGTHDNVVNAQIYSEGPKQLCKSPNYSILGAI